MRGVLYCRSVHYVCILGDAGAAERRGNHYRRYVSHTKVQTRDEPFIGRSKGVLLLLYYIWRIIVIAYSYKYSHPQCFTVAI